jgi:hypothetical protein
MPDLVRGRGLELSKDDVGSQVLKLKGRVLKDTVTLGIDNYEFGEVFATSGSGRIGPSMLQSSRNGIGSIVVMVRECHRSGVSAGIGQARRWPDWAPFRISLIIQSTCHLLR